MSSLPPVSCPPLILSRRRVVGVLGGSFNPAHEGHVHISLHALKSLGIDEVWWLVSPSNPLKDSASLADYHVRLQSARDMAAGTPIIVSDLEARRGLRYSWQTVAWLKARYPHVQFVWLMGADNLAQFHRWRRWRWLLSAVPVIVFDRAPYSHKSKQAKTYQRMRRFMMKDSDLGGYFASPGLHFVHLKRDHHSSTGIRKTLGKGTFLRHNKDVGKR